MQVTKEWLWKRITREHEFTPVDRLTTKDGLRVSVQAGKHLHCDPRLDKAEWTTVELGFPSEVVPEILEYAKDPEYPTQTVYGYVPIDLVVDVLNSRGGVINEG